MLEKINNLLQEVEGLALSTKEQVEEYRIKWLSKKGQITVLFDEFKTVSPEIKRELGQKLNELKNKAQEKIDLLKEKFESVSGNDIPGDLDLSLPGDPTLQVGSRHPLSIIKNEIITI